MVTAFVKWLTKQIGSLYVWGAQGQDLSTMADPVAWIRKREKGDEKQIARVLKQYNLKRGQKSLLAYDCSGLIIHWTTDLMKLTKGDMSANTLYSKYGEGRLNVSQLKQGDLLFVKGATKMVHVGVYIGSGQTIEAYGRDRGVVRLPLSSGEWSHMGRFPFLQASEPPKTDDPVSPVSPAIPKWVVSRVLKRVTPLMRGADVMELKQRLVQRGYLKTATKNTFGDDTVRAVKAFQEAEKLAVDGKAGKNTITRLGGVWDG